MQPQTPQHAVKVTVEKFRHTWPDQPLLKLIFEIYCSLTNESIAVCKQKTVFLYFIDPLNLTEVPKYVGNIRAMSGNKKTWWQNLSG